MELELVVLTVLFVIDYAHGASFTTQIGPKPIWNSTQTDKLRQDLLLNYDKFSRPSQHYNTTTVRFGITLRHFDLDEFKSQLVVYTWTRLLWNDDKLKWNESDYDGIKTLNLADHEIWQPDIFLYNSATSTAVGHYGNTPVVVTSEGAVNWVPATQMTVLCDIDLTYWPFDTQKCSMKFGSWTFSGNEIDLQLYNNDSDVMLEMLLDNTEWELLSSKLTRSVTYYACCDEPYPDIVSDLVIKRRSPSYKALIITPAFVIIFLNLISFWLPPQAGEKIILNGCNSVIICLFLLYFTQKLPAMGKHIPLVVLFYSTSLCITAFTTLSSVIVIWISRTPHSQSLPWIIKQHLTGTTGKILGLDGYSAQSCLSHRVTAEEMRDHQVTEFDDHNNEEHQMIRSSRKISTQQEWVLFAVAIDRISFIVYSFVFLILGIVYAI